MKTAIKSCVATVAAASCGAMLVATVRPAMAEDKGRAAQIARKNAAGKKSDYISFTNRCATRDFILIDGDGEYYTVANTARRKVSVRQNQRITATIGVYAARFGCHAVHPDVIGVG
ncbi:hypothetical protein HS041_33045 [Planomonospora sp. ID67723]|uniref:hypothetical protein n=1 Tax=Planomonospora sp. ID67723 TaxID=2738134 RepID=UPI0018C3E5FD|nr:hypothetical protein [Planomonospora sp. ID67723]MBG0832532.1 hypothetical protein [Planomonospora sp. ID67723]